MSSSRQAACAARYLRRRFGSSSAARRSSERAVRNASRVSARRPAPSSAVAAAIRSSSGARPSSSSRSSDRAVEMVRADLHQLVAGAIVQPARERLVELRPRRLAQASVRDLGDEDVLEAERALAGDRRALLEHDELARDERVEQRGDVELRSERLDGALPEDAADHRGALQQLLLRRRQRVDARGDERLDRVRDVVAHPLALGEHPQRLLEEERVALGLVEHERALLRQAGCRARPSASSSLSSGVSGASSIAAERRLPPPHDGRSSSSSGRVTQTMRSGASRTARAMCSITCSSGSSAQWMSSNTSTSGCMLANSSAHARAAQRSSSRLCSRSLAPISPAAAASRSAIASLSQHARSFSNASPIGSSSAIPADCLDHLGERPVRDALAEGQASGRAGSSRARRSRRTRRRGGSCRCRARRRR